MAALLIAIGFGSVSASNYERSGIGMDYIGSSVQRVSINVFDRLYIDGVIVCRIRVECLQTTAVICPHCLRNLTGACMVTFSLVDEAHSRLLVNPVKFKQMIFS